MSKKWLTVPSCNTVTLLLLSISKNKILSPDSFWSMSKILLLPWISIDVKWSPTFNKCIWSRFNWFDPPTILTKALWSLSCVIESVLLSPVILAALDKSVPIIKLLSPSCVMSKSIPLPLWVILILLSVLVVFFVVVTVVCCVDVMPDCGVDVAYNSPINSSVLALS